MVIYLLTLALAGLGLCMIFLHGIPALAAFGLGLGVLLLVFRAVGAVRLRETLSQARRVRRLSAEARQQQANFEAADLVFSDVASFDQWWQAVCETAQSLELVRVELVLTNRDGSPRRLTWRGNDALASSAGPLQAELPVRDRRAGGSLRLRAEGYVNGTAESACRRLTYLGRICDEHSVADLPAAGNGKAATDYARTVGNELDVPHAPPSVSVPDP
jgi:hypothetical protein